MKVRFNGIFWNAEFGINQESLTLTRYPRPGLKVEERIPALSHIDLSKRSKETSATWLNASQNALTV